MQRYRDGGATPEKMKKYSYPQHTGFMKEEGYYSGFAKPQNERDNPKCQIIMTQIIMSNEIQLKWPDSND
jgi:hypothetical protein